MADLEPSDPTPADSGGLVYLGPDPTTPGAHQVLVNGEATTVPFEGLPDSTKIEAINHAVAQPAQAPTVDMPPTGFDKLWTGALQPSVKQSLGFNQDGSRTVPANDSNGGAPGAGESEQTTGADTGGGAKPPPADDGPQPIPTPTQQTTGGGGGGGAPSTQSGDLATMRSASDKSVADQQASANTTYEANKAISGEQNDLAKSNLTAQAQRIQDFQQQQQESFRQAQDMLAKSAQYADEFAKSTIQPFPENVGSKLLNALAFMVSGAGAGATHQSNMAQEEYTKTVNNWLATQKYNIEHNKEAAQEFQTLFQKNLDLGMSRRQAFDATDKAYSDLAVKQSEQIVLAHGGQKALADFQANSGKLRDDQANKAAKLIQSTNETALNRATVAHLNAATRHENAETAQLGLAAGNTAAVKTGQTNLANKVPFAKLPQDQQMALKANAQANDMLIPGVGITQRKIEPAEHDKIQDMETANKLISDIDGLVKGRIATPAERVQAASKANILADLLPKVIGSQARLGPQVQTALKSVVPSDPGRLLTLWGQHGKALRSTIGEARSALHKDLGTTFFQPIQFTPGNGQP